MAMLEAGVKKVTDKHMVGEDDSEDSDDEEEVLEDPQATSREATVINFLLVQPKSLQDCRIVYDDAFSQPQIDSLELMVKKEPQSPTEELQKAADKITLMSPEVFGAGATPPKIKEELLETTVPKRGLAISNLVAMASGGSSPSREVQDILGDSEEQGGLGAEIVITEEDEEEDEEEEDEELLESDDSDELSRMLDKANAKIKQEQHQQQDPLAMKLKEELNIKSEPSWPIKEEIKDQSWNIEQEMKPASPILAGATASGATSMASSQNDIQMIMSRLADMTALIQTQRAEVQVWREEMRALRREDVSNFKSVLDDSTSEATNEMKKSSQVILNGIKTNVKNAINDEVKKATPKLVQAASVSLQEALNKEVNSKVLKADLQMKEALNKLVSSRAVNDSIANSIASVLAPAIHASCKDALISSVIPAFERSMQNLFSQLATTFNKGVKEYDGQFKTHVNKQIEPIVKELKDSAHRMKGSADLEKKLTHVIRNEIRQISTQTPAAQVTPTPESQGSAPMSMAEIQAKIRGLLMERNFNDAFATALSANNLAIVVALCEMVNIEILNQVPCPLSQEVLLSLIQQLGKKYFQWLFL